MLELQRRHFLMGALAAAPARNVKAQSSATVGAAMIGTGNRGTHMMRKVMEQAGVKVVALCDIKPDRLDKAASLAGHDNPATYSDYHRVLERKDVDAVHISTPCDLHVEMSIAALKAGKHVYCEKPVGITPDSIVKLIRVAKESKTVFQVGQQMRASTRLRETIAKIREGVAGKLVMVKAQRHASDDLAHDGTSADWFFNPGRSGDVIVEMSVHNLDLCNWVIGDHPERAGGFGGNLVWVNDPPGRTNMDGYTLSYDYQAGVKLSYIQVFFHPRGMPGGGQSTYVYGAQGGVDLSEATYYPLGRQGKPVVLAEPRKEDLDALHLAEFFAAIRDGKKPLADVMVGATGALTAILGREAIYRRKVLRWKSLQEEV